MAHQDNCRQRRCCCEPTLRWRLDTAQPSAKLQTDAFDQTLGDGGSCRACNGPTCDTSRLHTSQRFLRARPTQRWRRWAKGAEFSRMSTRWETTAPTAKMGLVLLGSANAASTLSVLYMQVTTPANAGTWALGEKSCLFLPCANFPGLAVESMWELLLGLVQGHGGAPAYQNW